MKRILALALVCIAPAGVFAQDAASLAAQRAAEERESRLTSEMRTLQESNLRQQQRINELINENNALVRKFTELENRFRNSQVSAVTREDLQKAYAKMSEINDARQKDRASLLEQINKVAELAATKPPPQIIVREPVAPVPTPKATTHSERTENQKKSEKEPEPVLDNPEGFFTYKIKKGDNLTSVIAAYNAELKDKNKKAITLDQVKKANPKTNPNNLIVGKEILIPVPGDK